jgi:SAM-dependent methyltransferase
MHGPPDRWWRGFDSLIVDATEPGGRVLDIGCGDGSLVHRLRARGLDAIGVDPEAPPDPYLVQQRAENLGMLGRFDAICAVMTLHHADLEAVLAKVAELLSPKGSLLIYDFAWETYDERAAGWVEAHDTSAIDNTVAGWHAEHAELHTGETMRAALVNRFVLRPTVPRPYLARMLRLLELESEEHALIENGSLPALGRHWIAAQR